MLTYNKLSLAFYSAKLVQDFGSQSYFGQTFRMLYGFSQAIILNGVFVLNRGPPK